MLTAGTACAETCDSYEFAQSAGYSAGKIVAKGKTRFQNGDGSEQTAYLLPNDEVLRLFSEGNRTCAVYIGNKTVETIGWLPSKALAPVKTAASWKGRFVRDELGSEVVLKPAKSGRVEIMMQAYWAMSLETAQNGGVNEGGMGDVVPIENSTAHIPPAPADNNNCEADLRLIGTRYLLVEDNRSKLGDDILTCAGHNVTFTGLYVRTK